MRALTRFAGERKSFTQPPFWSLDTPIWTSPPGVKEQIANDFAGYVHGAYKASGIVFTCSLVRLQVFSQINFRYEDRDDGRLYRDDTLSLLETPWTNGTTGELLARMEQDATLAGNFFATPREGRDGQRLRRLRPDWVTILTGSPSDDPFDIDAEVLGYFYEPKQGPRKVRPIFLLPEQVVHWSPIPDPEAQWRGMSWLTPVLREVEADIAATKHKSMFFKNGATPQVIVKYDKSTPPSTIREYIQLFKERSEGVDNAYKTLHLGGGGDATVVGANLRELDFKATQGAGETRIAAASGVGAIIAQFSEGMQGSSLNAGNYGAARRRFSDITMQHLWQTASGSLAKVTRPPSGSRLWFDKSGVPFLQEDQMDDAAIKSKDAQTIRTFVDAGFEPESVVAAVGTGDWSLLKHSGLYSVQLQEPGQYIDPRKPGDSIPVQA